VKRGDCGLGARRRRHSPSGWSEWNCGTDAPPVHSPAGRPSNAEFRLAPVGSFTEMPLWQRAPLDAIPGFRCGGNRSRTGTAGILPALLCPRFHQPRGMTAGGEAAENTRCQLAWKPSHPGTAAGKMPALPVHALPGPQTRMHPWGTLILHVSPKSFGEKKRSHRKSLW
jgi:hypothetical protein